MTSVLAWHFLKTDCRTGEEGILVSPGSVLHVDLPIELYKRGLHGSRQAIDALGYAFGPVVERVELYGTIIEGDDCLVATDRKCLWLADAAEVLHEFACQCAEDALRVAGVEDARCWSAIATKRAWLRGEVDDAELDAVKIVAPDDISDAVSFVTSDLAWVAAMETAIAAASSVAWATASALSSPSSAAWRAAWFAGQEAERARQNRRLTAMLSTLEPKEVKLR